MEGDLRHILLYSDRGHPKYARFVDAILRHAAVRDAAGREAAGVGLLPSTWSRGPPRFVLCSLFPLLNLSDRLVLEKISPAWRQGCRAAGWEDLAGPVLWPEMLDLFTVGGRNLATVRRLDLQLPPGALDATLIRWLPCMAKMCGIREFRWQGCARNFVPADFLASLRQLTSVDLDVLPRDGIAVPDSDSADAVFCSLARVDAPLCRLSVRLLEGWNTSWPEDFLLEAARQVTRSASACSHLESLTLTDSLEFSGTQRIGEEGWETLRRLAALRTLHLGGYDELVDRDGNPTSTLSGLHALAPTLTELKLCPSWRVSSFAPLGSLVNLTSLAFAGGYDDFCAPHSEGKLGFLSGLTNLRTLRVGGALGLEGLAPLTRLTDLDYSGDVQENEAAAALDCMPDLRRLCLCDSKSISYKRATLVLLAAISRHRSLTELRLRPRFCSSSPLGLVDLRGLASLPLLRELEVSETFWWPLASFTALNTLLAQGGFPALAKLVLLPSFFSAVLYSDWVVIGDCSLSDAAQKMVSETLAERSSRLAYP